MSVAVISFEELFKKYPTHNVPPYGACVVVPGDKFDPDWEALLEDCSCHPTDFEGKPVTLVRKDKGESKGERVVFSPEQKPEGVTKSPPHYEPEPEKHFVAWAKEEIERFIKLWNDDPNYEKILKSFPNRTKIALIQKATELKKAGIIENAYVVKAKLKKGDSLKPVPEINVRPVGSPLFRRDEYLWSEKDEKLVIALWNAKKTAAQIQEELVKANPGRSMETRSVTAIRAEITRLEVRGLIKRRFGWTKKKEPKELDAPAATSSQASPKWRPEEDEVLVKLWNERVLIEKMTPSFPGRTEAAIRLRIQRLQKYGKIEKRSGRGRQKLERPLKGRTEPPPTDTTREPERRWTEEDFEQLIQFWNAKLPLKEIWAKFPGYSEASIKSRLRRLAVKGRIKSRWHKRNKVVEPQASVEKSDTPIPPSPPESLTDLLKQVLDALRLQEESVCFESYCPHCRERRSVEDSNVWKACPVCGGPLIVWNVEVST
jgi:hypothetical protein